MSEFRQGAHHLEARLAEMDRTLRDIQSELVPEGSDPPSEPMRATAPPEPEPEPARGPEPESRRARRAAARGRSGPLATLLQRGPRPEQPPRMGGEESAPREESAPPEQSPPEPPGGGSAEPPGERERSSPREPEPPPPPAPDYQVEALTELYGRLLASMRDLLDGYESLLGQMTRSRGGFMPADRPFPPRAPEISISAGPFASTTALRDFAQAMSRIPGVREVTLRGYEGADRAIVDVQLERR